MCSRPQESQDKENKLPSQSLLVADDVSTIDILQDLSLSSNIDHKNLIVSLHQDLQSNRNVLSQLQEHVQS